MFEFSGPIFLNGYFRCSRWTQIVLLSAAVHTGREPDAAWDRLIEKNLCVYTCKCLHVYIRALQRISPNLNHSTPQSTAKRLWQCHKSQLAAATYEKQNIIWNVKRSTPTAKHPKFFGFFSLFIPPFFSRFMVCTDVLSCNLYKLLAVLDDATTKWF